MRLHRRWAEEAQVPWHENGVADFHRAVMGEQEEVCPVGDRPGRTRASTYKVCASSRSALEFEAFDRAIVGHECNPDARLLDEWPLTPCLCKPAKRWGIRNGCDHEVIGRDVKQ